MRSMDSYPKAAMERAMKVQDVMLQAMAKKITWWQAAEILGISDRHMRRWRSAMRKRATTGCETGGGASRRRDGCRWSWWRRYGALTGKVFGSERAAFSREAAGSGVSGAGAEAWGAS